MKPVQVEYYYLKFKPYIIKKMEAQRLADYYLENYEENALEQLQKDVNKMNQKFDAMGYTPEELREFKNMKEAIKILEDYV